MNSTGTARRGLLACALAAGLLAPGTGWADDGLGLLRSPRKWVETWAASPQQPVDPLIAGTSFDVPPRSFSGQTIRQVVRLSTGGGTVRIRLTNEYGTAPVSIDAVRVAVAADGGEIVPGTDRAVTFNGGAAGVAIPIAAPAVSDPIEFPVPGLTSLSISIFVPGGGNPGFATPHTLGQQTAYVAPGDQTGAAALTGATTTTVRYFLSGVDVLKGRLGATVVTLGDSITDGFNSTVDANRRWPDILAQRLQGSVVLRDLGVANQGISGNRVLSEGFGPNALSRFDRDVLSRPGVRSVILLEGINDIGLPNLSAVLPNAGAAPSAEGIIAGYRQLIARARANDVLIFGGTLTPYEGALYHTAEGEAKRGAVNAFIRESGEFDGVIDFDAAVRDPANPLRLLPAYDSGDHLHPSDAGYASMAAAVDLRLFLPLRQSQDRQSQDR